MQMNDDVELYLHIFLFDVFKNDGKNVSKCGVSVFLCLPFHLSTSSTETPKLPQRIIDAVKSYIYTPEEGKHVVLLLCYVWSCLQVLCLVKFV